MQVDISGWSGEGTFTQVLIDELRRIDGIAFVRVEDAPASRSEADYNFISNEIFVGFAATEREERTTRFGFLPARRLVNEKAMNVAGLERATPVRGRLRSVPGRNGATIIDDSYNANPGSVHAAIDHLAALKGKRILVFGNMAERNFVVLGGPVADTSRAADFYKHYYNAMVQFYFCDALTAELGSDPYRRIAGLEGARLAT